MLPVKRVSDSLILHNYSLTHKHAKLIVWYSDFSVLSQPTEKQILNTQIHNFKTYTMKKILYTCLMFLAVLDSRAQTTKFDLTPSTWPTPTGGEVLNNNQLGFNWVSGSSVVGQSTGSQTWSLVDMNGDKKPDLVVTSAVGLNGAAQFNVATSPNWQVYLNTSAGFSTTATSWPTPQGGLSLLGLNSTSSSVTGIFNGAEAWDLVDMNGDGKPDLVITDSIGLSGPAQFGANTANQSWRVYLNTGSGFSNTPLTWITPTGGTFNAGGDTVLGFIFTKGTGTAGQGLGSQSWSLVDMDGDGKPDLVVTADLTNNGPAQDIIGQQGTWHVYLNTGTGFSINPTVWNTPLDSPGIIAGGNTLGFNAVNGNAMGESTGSQSWSLIDMNGDGKPDLVITATVGANGLSESNPSTNPTWAVFLNTGSGFSTTATSWATPQGGYMTTGAAILGFNGTLNVGNTVTQGVNSQSWVVTDMNGDGKPDLVVPASLGNTGPHTWSPGTDDYWEVYLNTGSAFSNTSTFWFIPNGGEHNASYLGFNFTSGLASATGGDITNSASWSLTDLDGDGFPDLVQTGAIASSNNTEASPTSHPYWQVYRNAGAPVGTGILNTSQAAFDCRLYPNPNNGNFKLVFNDDAVREVEVTDVTGQVLINNLHVARQAEIALPSFAQGIYFVAIRQNGLAKVMMVSVTK